MSALPAFAKTFTSFKDLEVHYQEGVDYRISVTRGLHPNIAVVAPHGGDIEKPTSRIAAAIARTEFSCYLFAGIREEHNYDALHLASEYFDEPRCLELIAGCDQVVTVHGCKGDEIEVLLGGLDRALAAILAEALADEGVRSRLTGHKFGGTLPTNICNQGKSKAGAQLELTKALRNSPDAIDSVVRAVRRVLLRFAQ